MRSHSEHSRSSGALLTLHPPFFAFLSFFLFAERVVDTRGRRKGRKEKRGRPPRGRGAPLWVRPAFGPPSFSPPLLFFAVSPFPVLNRRLDDERGERTFRTAAPPPGGGLRSVLPKSSNPTSRNSSTAFCCLPFAGKEGLVSGRENPLSPLSTHKTGALRPAPEGERRPDAEENLSRGVLAPPPLGCVIASPPPRLPRLDGEKERRRRAHPAERETFLPRTRTALLGRPALVRQRAFDHVP